MFAKVCGMRILQIRGGFESFAKGGFRAAACFAQESPPVLLSTQFSWCATKVAAAGFSQESSPTLSSSQFS